MVVVVMGVAGVGKTTVGAEIARRLDARFLDGDSLHRPENIEKMRRGIPLGDTDREPWLRQLASLMSAAEARKEDLVIASSALKRAYRDLFRQAAPGVRFVFLEGSLECLRRRLEARIGHFMPASLLESQLATLEPPGSDERALALDATRPVSELAEQAARWLSTKERELPGKR